MSDTGSVGVVAKSAVVRVRKTPSLSKSATAATATAPSGMVGGGVAEQRVGETDVVVVVDAATIAEHDATLGSKYKKRTDREHVLLNSDTYIGSRDNVMEALWVFDKGQQRIVERQMEHNPGFYKLFDEVLVNASDHAVRTWQWHEALMKKWKAENLGASSSPPASYLAGVKQVTYIKIATAADGTISVENDGNGIDIAMHPEHQVWIPQMIFSDMKSSTNFKEDEDRIVGGKNGFGVKLAFIWSRHGTMETVDHVRRMKYVQEFSDNLGVIHPPTVTSQLSATLASKPYTKIAYLPDYERFQMPHRLTPDIMALFHRRAIDISAVLNSFLPKRVKVYFNDELIPVHTFEEYVSLYLGPKPPSAAALKKQASTGLASASASAAGAEDEDETLDEVHRAIQTMEYVPRVMETLHRTEHWDFAVGISPSNTFQQVSFVNGIATTKGGKHVEMLASRIVARLVVYIKEKRKVDVNLSTVREQLFLFVRCNVVNPTFESQTKDYLNTKLEKLFPVTISDAFIEKVAKMGGNRIMDRACAVTEIRDNKRVARNTDGRKVKSVRGIDNLMDANWAGTDKSRQCTLILCEGNSAMAGVVSGFSQEDMNQYGVFPVRGKLMNVRGESKVKIGNNKEITNIKKILGLESGRSYVTEEDLDRLRYGHVMILSDQDTDGSHIKALVVNMFHCEWPSLTLAPGFLSFMNTPLLKAMRSGQTTRSFYNVGEFEAWKRAEGDSFSAWKIKYFKGLGTSTAEDFKEYFGPLKKIVSFQHQGATTDDTIDKVFNSKRSADRKTWLGQYNPQSFLNTSANQVSYEDFIDKEMIHFSFEDNRRSLPSAVDGLKESLRKILYACFKRNLRSEIKVAQLAGYVSEHTAYHHGEASLNGAIVNLAQDFVGSNNINLLVPSGQFGTRLGGGKDAASERYIFTHLNPLAFLLFRPEDAPVLTYVEDDGEVVEPHHYCPIIPFALINGIEGIGTGYSCSIPAYNPEDVIRLVQHMLRTGERDATVAARAVLPTMVDGAPVLVPFALGFKGTVTPVTATQFLVRGVHARAGTDVTTITELPIGTWTLPYKAELEKMCEDRDEDGKKIPATLKDVTFNSTDRKVHITVTYPRGKMAELEYAPPGKNGVTELEKHLKLTTLLSSTNFHLFDKDGRLRKFQSPFDIVNEYFPVRRNCYERRKQHQLHMMERDLVKATNKARFIELTIAGTIDLRNKSTQEMNDLLVAHQLVPLSEDAAASSSSSSAAVSFAYLTNMRMSSVTRENFAKLVQERDQIEAKLTTLRGTTVEQLWLQELDELQTAYEQYKQHRLAKMDRADKGSSSSSSSRGGTASSKTSASAKRVSDNHSTLSSKRPRPL